MNTVEIIVVSLFIIVTVVLWAAALYLFYRNEKVYVFRRRIIDLCNEYCNRNIEKITCADIDDIFIRYVHKYSYREMLFSLKPLRLESWFTEEEIKELMS